MKIVLDTNILFSALLNSNGTIGDVIFNSEDAFEFYGGAYLRFEIRKHWAKLKKLTGLTDSRLAIAHDSLLVRTHFINEQIVSPQIWIIAEEIVSAIDLHDVAFVALALHLNSGLWTGDKVLYKRLKRTGFKHVYNTAELVALRNRLRENRS